mgnify:CR=1 FL=1
MQEDHGLVNTGYLVSIISIAYSYYNDNISIDHILIVMGNTREEQRE